MDLLRVDRLTLDAPVWVRAFVDGWKESRADSRSRCRTNGPVAARPAPAHCQALFGTVNLFLGLALAAVAGLLAYCRREATWLLLCVALRHPCLSTC